MSEVPRRAKRVGMMKMMKMMMMMIMAGDRSSRLNTTTKEGSIQAVPCSTQVNTCANARFPCAPKQWGNTCGDQYIITIPIVSHKERGEDQTTDKDLPCACSGCSRGRPSVPLLKLNNSAHSLASAVETCGHRLDCARDKPYGSKAEYARTRRLRDSRLGTWAPPDC
jgi:hypothetical protein